MIDRRALIVSAAGSMFTASRVGRAQAARKVYRIGILGLRPTSDLVGREPRSPSTKAFLRGMREFGCPRSSGPTRRSPSSWRLSTIP